MSHLWSLFLSDGLLGALIGKSLKFTAFEREINYLLESLKNVPVSETEGSGKCFEKSKLVGKIKGSI